MYRSVSLIETDVSILKSSSLRGTVSGYSIGSRTRARILDDTNAVRVYYSRLNGAELESSDVRYYATNEAGEITDLILRDFTGDLYQSTLVDDMTCPAVKYLLDGERTTVTTSGKTPGRVLWPRPA